MMIDLLNQSPKHEEDACQHPGLDSGESLRLGSVGGDGVEDVDQHQEQGDEESHPARYDVRRYLLYQSVLITFVTIRDW